jgi:SHS2 domain-containing protein
MGEGPAGFREVEHTADWALEVWGPDLETILVQAAQGMYQLSGMELQDDPPMARYLEIEGVDAESLLVSFLTELLFFGEDEGLGFEVFEISLEENKLMAELEGAPISRLQKEIKAVTYHNLNVEQGSQGLEVTIVFDV